MSASTRPARLRARRRDAGLTLVEVIVSLFLLTIMAGAVSAAFGVGFKAFAPGQAQDRLAGAHDQERFEQNLGQDVARAACITVGNGTTYPTTGCTNGFANSSIASVCSNADTVLCVGWPDVGESSCHVVAYTNSAATSTGSGLVNATGLVRRAEYKVPIGGSETPLEATGLTTDNVAVSIAIPAASGSTSVLVPVGSYQWVKTLTITVTAKGIANGTAQTLATHPVSTDPAGQASQITSTGSPC